MLKREDLCINSPESINSAVAVATKSRRPAPALTGKLRRLGCSNDSPHVRKNNINFTNFGHVNQAFNRGP